MAFYSPAAYRYLRRTLNNSLPAPSTIRSWYSAVDGGPGITHEAIEMLKQKAQATSKVLEVCLSVDEMAIRQSLQFNSQTKTMSGYVTVASARATNNIATKALVYLVTSIHEKFKIPVGYFFVNGLDGLELAAVTDEVIRVLTEAGVKIRAMVFDGHPSNIKMAEALGANLSNYEPFIHNKYDPSNDIIFFLLDAVHMYKLVRNNLGNRGCYYVNFDRDNGEVDKRKIEWNFIEKLVEYQDTHETPITKLTPAHINYSANAMSVKLAMQTLSASVGHALLTASTSIAGFENAEETGNFCLMMNNVIDVLNSEINFKTPDVNYGFKAPMSSMNINKIKCLFKSVETYIHSMETTTKKGNFIKLLHSNIKTGFVGLLWLMKNFVNMYEKYVVTGTWKNIQTFHFSQDQLETLFGCARRSLGDNTNPTTEQFTAAYKKLLFANEVEASSYGNCEPNDIKLLTISSKRQKGSETQSEEQSIPQPIPAAWTEAPRSVIAYYASHIEELCKTNNCTACQEIFVQNDKEFDDFVKLRKVNEAIDFPCVSTVEICLIAEKYLPSDYQKMDFNSVLNSIMNELNTRMGAFYTKSSFVHNDDDEQHDHQVAFIKMLVNGFLSIRFKQLSALRTAAVYQKSTKKRKIDHHKGK